MAKPSEPKDLRVRCTCKSCGNRWSYMQSDEVKLKQKASMGNLICDDGICGNPYGNMFLHELIPASDRKHEYDKCPKCMSMNITKEVG